MKLKLLFLLILSVFLSGCYATFYHIQDDKIDYDVYTYDVNFIYGCRYENEQWYYDYYYNLYLIPVLIIVAHIHIITNQDDKTNIIITSN